MRKLLAILLRILTFIILIPYLILVLPFVFILLTCEIIFYGDVEDTHVDIVTKPFYLFDLAKKIENEKI